MSPDTMQNWLIIVGLVAAGILGALSLRFFALMTDRRLQHVVDAERRRNEAEFEQDNQEST